MPTKANLYGWQSWIRLDWSQTWHWQRFASQMKGLQEYLDNFQQRVEWTQSSKDRVDAVCKGLSAARANEGSISFSWSKYFQKQRRGHICLMWVDWGKAKSGHLGWEWEGSVSGNLNTYCNCRWLMHSQWIHSPLF